MICRLEIIASTLPEQIIPRIFVVLLCTALCLPLHASPIVTFTLQKSPVWVQQNDVITELNNDSKLQGGDLIITGDTGRIEIHLGSNMNLELHENTEIEIPEEEKAEEEKAEAASSNRAELYIHGGMVCIDWQSQTGSGNKIRIMVGSEMLLSTHLASEFCVDRKDLFSSVKLFSGGVQISHLVNTEIVVLGEAGTEVRIQHNGSYEWIYPDSMNSLDPTGGDTVVDDFETKLQLENDASQTQTADVPLNLDVPENGENIFDVVDENTVLETGGGESESLPLNEKNASASAFTVYLFSTRSGEEADKANRKFREAGYSTQIKVYESDSITRYRIIMPGFKSRISAKEFASSIVGKLGVTETWIGEKL